ncbi:MAG: formamidopyrimidine-DNA glycosylase [Proteobacteria bacterium]|nr:formamidopyrimidine-DNA glycosylase [Pseudomonadota bacterium]
MPELPDITIYIERLRALLHGHPLVRATLFSPFVLRSIDPPIAETHDRTVTGARRIGKRIVLELEGELYLVVHLMIAGRLKWQKLSSKVPRKIALVRFEFAHGALFLTEASAKKRASLHVVRGEAGLGQFDRGGIEVMGCSPSQFRAALIRENHTLKRALTDPRILSGIGNAYSDEILHRARMSPFVQTHKLDDEGFERLYRATIDVLAEWIERLRAHTGDRFPERVTAFRDEMAVHGKYRQPCPVCQAPVQRIVYAQNEANYCARCQTGGKLLADRALSRLLKKNWPRTLEELEERRST